MAKITRATINAGVQPILRRLAHRMASNGTVSIGVICSELCNNPKTLADFRNDFSGQYYIDMEDIEDWFYARELDRVVAAIM
jgi:hypothetical protein